METINVPSYSEIAVKGVFDYVKQFSLTSLGKFTAALPIALHAGWLMAAALLNVNTRVTESGATLGQNISMAFCSVYVAGLSGHMFR